MIYSLSKPYAFMAYMGKRCSVLKMGTLYYREAVFTILLQIILNNMVEFLLLNTHPYSISFIPA